MRSRPFVIIAFLFLVIYFAGFHVRGDSVMIKTAEGANHRVAVEVARSPEQRRLGLMNREGLSSGRGMLFVFEGEARPVMWMKNMNFPIDIVFADSEAMISHIEKDAEPCFAVDDRYCPRYRSEVASRYVLELPAGFTERYSVKRGDLLALPSGL